VRIAVLGGGPGGLLAALLAKRGDPAREVTVFERNQAGDTFGFGVVFSDATLDGIDAADPVLRRALTERWRHRAGPFNRTAIALLGDAAHTAHFSVGSGTKMAMEDAIALVGAGWRSTGRHGP
jgi:2-polyprenyl-6-methoxyphenol hydroxylase-like FAD-dependent oxidoreductase